MLWLVVLLLVVSAQPVAALQVQLLAQGWAWGWAV
jgi:hypothetical protein